MGESMMDEASLTQQIDVMEYYRLVVRHKWLILTCVVVGITVAVWYNSQAKPVYRAVATMALNDSPARSPFGGEPMLYGDFINQRLAFQTHSKLITSRPVLMLVAQDLKLSQTSLPHRDNPGLFQQLLHNVDLMLGRKPKTASQKAVMNPLAGAQIHVEEVRNTLLMNIVVDDTDPTMAMDIANTTVKDYIKYDISSRMKSSRNSVSWMSDQIYDVEKKLNDAEQEFLAYKQNEKLFSMKGRQEQISGNIDDFNKSYIQTKNKLLELDAKLQELQGTSGPHGRLKDAGAQVSNPIISDLYRQRMDAEVQLSKLSSIYKPQHPKIIEITTEISQINSKIREEIGKEIANLNAEKATLKVRENSLKNAIAGFESDALDTNRKELKYGILERNVQVYQQLYDTLLAKMKQSNITNTAETSNLHIAEEADLPMFPISPRKGRNVIIGAFLGLIAGLGITYLMDYFDRSIKSEEDVRKYLGVSVLSVIPLAEGIQKSDG